MQHLNQRGGMFNWRRKVPQALVSRLGRTHLTHSLRTSDRALATVRARRLSSAADRLFALAMSDTTLSPDQIDDLVRQWLEAALEEDEQHRAEAAPGRPLYAVSVRERDPVEADLDLLADWLIDAREALAENDIRKVEADAQDILRDAGLDLDRCSQAYRRLCRGLLRARVEMYRLAAARRVGDYKTQPIDPLFAQDAPRHPASGKGRRQAEDPRAASMPLNELVEVYISAKMRDGEWGTLTAKNHPRKLRLFAETLKNKPVDLVTRDDIRDWRDLLAHDLDLAPNSIGQHFRVVGAMFKWAKVEGKCSIDDPTKGLAPESESATRVAYSPEDLRTLFHSPLYTGHWRADRRERPGRMLIKDHKYWLPLISLHSGLRVEEAAKLTTGDVQMLGGVWCFSVTDTKTAAGTRIVPVHPRLMALGFLDYRRCVLQNGGGQLWPDLKKGSEGRYSSRFVQWWSGFRRLIGLGRPGLTFHSLRHTFISSMEKAGIPETLAAQIAGHSVQKGITYGVYGGKLLGPRERLDLIKDLDFGVGLEHLITGK